MQYGCFTYFTTTGSRIRIVGYTCTNPVVVIPSYIGTIYRVGRIEANAFLDKGITSLELPPYTDEIRLGSFAGNNNIVEINILSAVDSPLILWSDTSSGLNGFRTYFLSISRVRGHYYYYDGAWHNVPKPIAKHGRNRPSSMAKSSFSWYRRGGRVV